MVAALPRCELSDLDAETVTHFLDHIETHTVELGGHTQLSARCDPRLLQAPVRNDLAHSQQYMRVLAIPSKKARQRPATYLEADDVRLIIGMPDRRTHDGWRDYTLLLFLYNCGARVSEAAGVRWDDLQLTAPRQVRLLGKGRKERCCRCGRRRPTRCTGCAASGTARDQQCVFVNRHGQPLTRDGIAYVLRKHAAAAARAATRRCSASASRLTCCDIAAPWRCCSRAPM